MVRPRSLGKKPHEQNEQDKWLEIILMIVIRSLEGVTVIKKQKILATLGS